MSLLGLDFDAKKRLGYRYPKTRVYDTGREVLGPKDWKKRCRELKDRSGGRCENILVMERTRLIVPGTYGTSLEDRIRCGNDGGEPHHIVLRSELRDDRLKALMDICHWCHAKLDKQQREAHRKASMERKGLVA